MLAGLIILCPPAIYFLTRHQITTGPPPASERAGQRSTPGDQPVDRSVSEIGQPGASNGVTPPAPNTPEAQPTPAGPTNSTLRETTSGIPPCDEPDGLGLTRIVQIDTTGGPEFGAQHLKGYDFLRDKEVVLTFDDGPRLGSTETVLKALADECLRATFFEVGEYAR